MSGIHVGKLARTFVAETFIYQVGRAGDGYAQFRCPREVERSGNEIGLESVVRNNDRVRNTADGTVRDAKKTTTIPFGIVV